jgi:hypothetical protein
MIVFLKYLDNKKLMPTHGKKHWSEGRLASLAARIKLAHGGCERSQQLQRFLTVGTSDCLKTYRSSFYIWIAICNLGQKLKTQRVYNSF